MISRIYENVITEHFDINDDNTRSTLLNIDEADQSKVLESLTSKLYKSIMDKVDDIDFGSIPETKGDITKLENYNELLECINVIRSILIEYRQDLTPVDTILTAITNVQDRKDLFEKGFVFKLDLPILMYNSIVLSIVSSVSLIIATSIEFIKDAGEQSFNISFDKVAYVRSKDNVLFQNLQKFNRACSSGEMDRSIEYVIKSGSKQLLGVDTLTVVSVAAVIAIVVNIIPILRELVFFYYHCKQSIADYFAIQSELLKINAEYVKTNPISGKTDAERREIVKKQSKVADFFKKIANALDIDMKTAESKSKKDLNASNKKYKLDELEVDKLDSAPEKSSIF